MVDGLNGQTGVPVLTVVVQEITSEIGHVPTLYLSIMVLGVQVMCQKWHLALDLAHVSITWFLHPI